MMGTPEDVKARVEQAYNAASDFYDHEANSFWSLYGRRTVERIGMTPGERVLDLCCGCGASAIPAAERVGPRGRVLAVDLATQLVGKGRTKAARLGLSNLEFRVADLLTLTPKGDGGGFDHVVCVFGLFFLPDMAAGARHMWSLVRPGGRLAITTWGAGLFEPINSYFWDSVRSRRADLYKAFNPWDRLGEPDLVARLFTEAGLPEPTIVMERGSHAVPGADDLLALLMGSGYRGVLERLPAEERALVCELVLSKARSEQVTEVGADVIYATCRKAA